MIEITKRASDALLAAIERTKGQAAGVRITAHKEGCSGLDYTMGLVTGGLEEDQEITTTAGVTVFISEESIPLLIGSVLDYGETENGQAFSFFNPSSLLADSSPGPSHAGASHGCSCGKSSCGS